MWSKNLRITLVCLSFDKNSTFLHFMQHWKQWAINKNYFFFCNIFFYYFSLTDLFHQLGPLGWVGLVVAISVYVYYVPFSCNFFRGLSLALRSHDQIPTFTTLSVTMASVFWKWKEIYIITMIRSRPSQRCPSRWHQYSENEKKCI